MEQNAEEPQDEYDDQLGRLMELLRDGRQDHPVRGSFPLRYQAVEGLVKVGVTAVIPLCQALQDPDAYTRRFAANALARIGDSRAVAPLISAFQESEVYVQRYVAGALAVLGDTQAIGPLCIALRNPEIAQESLRALCAVLERAANTASLNDLRLVAGLKDGGHYVVEVPDTDGGYLSWERVEYPLDCRAARQLAQKELERRGLAA